MINGENYEVKGIDKMRVEELRRKLKIRKDNVDILGKEKIDKIFEKIEEKKQVIFLLFQGDFSINEQNIKERIYRNRQELSFCDKIANRVILKRVDEIFNRMMSLEAQNCRLISVCADRQFFIQKVISENVKTAFIEDCINNNEIEK